MQVIGKPGSLIVAVNYVNFEYLLPDDTEKFQVSPGKDISNSGYVYLKKRGGWQYPAGDGQA